MIRVCYWESIEMYLSEKQMSYSHWSYLGHEYQNLNVIADKLNGIPHKNVNYLFDKISKDLKAAFIELISSFVSDKTKLSWWCSCLSHKSGYTCAVLRDFILFFVFKDIFDSYGDDDVLLVVESLPLYNSLYKNFGDEVAFYEPEIEYNEAENLHIIKKRIDYITETIKRSQCGVRYVPENSITLIATWLNLGIAKKDNPFDVYYGQLNNFFKNQSVNSYYFGYIWDYENYFEVKRRISEKYDNVIFPEDYLSALEVIKSAALPLLQEVNLKRVSFGEYDLSSLFKYYLAEERQDTHNSVCFSFYYVFKNLKKAGFKIDKFIYPFENQPWEKACIQGVRDFYPECKIIAFKHTTVPQFMLAHFPTKRELGKMPVPDKIVCCGKSSYKALYPYWSDKCNLEQGPALRHSYMFSEMKVDSKCGNVGAALSINVDENIEFLDLILKTAAKLDVSFYIKFHPAANNDILIRQLKSANLDNVKIFEGTPSEFLSKIGVMLFTATDLSVQAALAGIPVICYMTMAKLDMNPVNDSFIFKKVYDDNSLYEAVIEALLDRKNFRIPSLNDYYNKADDTKLACFIS